MSIKINVDRFFLRDHTSDNVVEVGGTTVGQCLHHLLKKLPSIKEELLLDGEGKLLDYVCIFVNGEDAFPEQLTKPVRDGDKINIIPVIAGG